MTVEICLKSPSEAQQRSVPGQHEHGRARRKEVMVRPSQAESTKGMEVVIGEERHTRMIKPSPKDGHWKKNERRKPQSRLKATFDILMAKYREDRAGITERENQIIQFFWIKPIILQMAAGPASHPGHCHDKIQKVGIIIKRSII
jgi:hypothetical protein